MPSVSAAQRTQRQHSRRSSRSDAIASALTLTAPHQHGVSAFMRVYRIQAERTPDYNRDDFVEASWLTPADLLHRISQADCAKDDLPRLIAHCFSSNQS